tara:strand:- start:49 stop:504 length:456 start_codon:yes stop_codon:yes gene_type:complete
MKITKKRLAQIIREEIMAHPAITSWGDKRLKKLAKEKEAARARRAYKERVAIAKEEPGFQWALEADDEGWGFDSLEEVIRDEIVATLAESDAMKEKAVRAAWENYCSGIGAHPKDQYTGKNLPTPDWLDARDCNKRRAAAKANKEGALKRR